MRVLVLGGRGFIGQAVVSGLTAAGHQPVVASSHLGAPPARQSGTAPVPERVQVNLLDRGSVISALEGVEGVVNAAGGSPAALSRGPEILFDAAQQAGRPRIVHLSSMAVYGGQAGRVAESTPFGLGTTAYAEAKRAGEAAAERASQAGLGVVTLRPTIVYGPGSRQWTVRIARLLKSRRLGDLGEAGQGTANLLYVDDLARAACLALESRVPSVAYNITGPGTVSWNEYFHLLAQSLGLRGRGGPGPARLKLESRLLHPLLKVAERARLLREPDTISGEMLRGFAGRFEIDATRAAEDLGFRAEISVPEGVARSAAWLKAERLP